VLQHRNRLKVIQTWSLRTIARSNRIYPQLPSYLTIHLRPRWWWASQARGQRVKDSWTTLLLRAIIHWWIKRINSLVLRQWQLVHLLRNSSLQFQHQLQLPLLQLLLIQPLCQWTFRKASKLLPVISCVHWKNKTSRAQRRKWTNS